MSAATYGGDNLNQAAAHDSSLYDPTIHDNQIVALYETDTQARAAQQTLLDAGFSASAIQVVARETNTGGPATGTGGISHEPVADEGIWGSIKSLFVPDEERSTYNTAIARGHAMLIVTPDTTMDRQHLIHVLESTDPLDFDAKLEEWRQSGYEGSSAMTSATHTGALGMASMTPPASVAPAAPITTGYTAPTTGSATSPTSGPVTGTTTAQTNRTTGADTIQVLEEKLRVGKREVAGGAVRVRSYIVERPVQEQVNLHEEHITVQRTPVDRPATGVDLGAFQERTIEARATSEEAVVTKEARVVEEIALNKQATNRTETVHDTVRKTEVEVEGADSAAKTGSLGSKVGANPNATPGATTSGANAPRK